MIKIEVTVKSCHYDSFKKVTTTSIQALFKDGRNLYLPNKAELVQIKSYCKKCDFLLEEGMFHNVFEEKPAK
jgi:hypothetical protein